MRDFTPETYKLLLTSLLDNDYSFQPFLDFLKNAESRSVILRHDVDARKFKSLRTAMLENELGIRGTYYFRMVPESFDEEVIRQIYDLGHEIGYHYEDVSSTAQRRKGAKAQRRNRPVDEKIIVEAAIISFKEKLEKLRKIVPVETICMHGSPLSRWDNRLLWKYYDYRDFGIVGEPYFDIYFEKVLYLTDTGRRWDGGTVAVRDKVTGKEEEMRREGEEGKGREEMMRRGGDEEKGREGAKEYRDKAIPPSPYPPLSHSYYQFHSTFDIINTARDNRLPEQIMLTVHPQRWDDRVFPWIRELVWQNVKNTVKQVVVEKQKR